MEEIEKTSLIKEGLPSALLLVILLVIGLVLDKMGQNIHQAGVPFDGSFLCSYLWGGDLRGLYRRKKQQEMQSDSTDTMMSSRSVSPSDDVVFTMSATWVGGGYINGRPNILITQAMALFGFGPLGVCPELNFGRSFFRKKDEAARI